MNEINKLIGAKIKEKRIELGITQYELGRVLGASQQQIQNYEVGYCAMSIEYIFAIETPFFMPPS